MLLYKDVDKIAYKVNQELGGGELSLPVYPGVGNRPPRKKKIANAQSRWGGGGGWGGGCMVIAFRHI